MSFLGVHVLTDKQFEALKAAGHEIEHFALSEVQKAVLQLKSTDIGAAVAADIAAVDNHELSGAEKFEKVLANTLPLIVKYVTGGGVHALVDDVKDIGRELVQLVFNEVKSSTAGKIAAQIVHAVGL